MATKTQVLNHFRSELGYVEGPRNNQTKFAAEAGHAPNLAWCATFVTAMFRRAGMTLPSESPWTPSMLNGLTKSGAKISNTPEVGALAFLYFPRLKRVAHVGIVEAVRADGRFVSIEGNTDVAGGRTGGRVMRKLRSPEGWTFAMPNYDEAPKPKPKAPVHGVENVVHRIQRSLEVDVDGKWGPETDRRAILMRNAARAHRGYPSNRPSVFDNRAVQRVVDTTVDGQWGPKSQAALVRWIEEFQRVIGVESDGRWGPRTDGRFIGLRNKYRNKF